MARDAEAHDEDVDTEGAGPSIRHLPSLRLCVHRKQFVFLGNRYAFVLIFIAQKSSTSDVTAIIVAAIAPPGPIIKTATNF